ncbi:tRNA (adenosine(37)-N6)-threonylcarbamoyltransferase complex ATPase subunit type 1 TsaE [Erysipelothrix sp. HDW6A]|uniref:tRNA (adenosine(37)-N6)-threonylcarbamoyltransferase complex ATPase subunit type 1 TsaE n=1 Tax=Erysipelothrix sp. HDW6A TaxID=2714928 RepID=UPI00140B50ED|nr:tRNA (adenosine(37)-N6)-threonylcarbamoyltransferase complex ATPase subunit type 1 TsaE [Erysipelothrix sp. HDW6A]QIK57680.1 tRNA (adenosine(37)-N6)-threonylcarbamoyltransferase complex ATPase subunit type 1 TsaE [Erysipelothrix sp. HDW6A]
MIKEYTTHSVNETMEIAQNFGKQIGKGCVISLVGDLGVGKTAFTKGLAKGLDISDTITSPTFTLLKEYEGRLNLKHIDAYRLETVSSDTLGLYDLIDDENVVVLEWGQFLDDIDFEVDVTISINYIDENTRTIKFEGTSI